MSRGRRPTARRAGRVPGPYKRGVGVTRGELVVAKWGAKRGANEGPRRWMTADDDGLFPQLIGEAVAGPGRR